MPTKDRTETNASPDLIERLSSSQKTSNNRTNKEMCELYNESISDYVGELCSHKVNTMQSDNENANCSCDPGDPSEKGADLIILVDSSGSMHGTWASLAAAAADAIKSAKAKCGVDPRVEWLFVDDSDSGVSTTAPPPTPPPFLKSHEKYLSDIGVPGPFTADGDNGWDKEQGGKAIVDLARHFDWTEGACRAIFYVSDEKLDSYLNTINDSRIAADAAITAANIANVTIFAHYVKTTNPIIPAVSQHYQDLANDTGGRAQIGGTPSSDLYIELLQDAICNACGEERCTNVEIPEIHPCISVKWGDSKCDSMESSDLQSVCITICNCYENVTFSNLMVQYVYVVDEVGHAVPRLPDGTLSVQAIPVGPICFGDIGPCTDEKKSCVSREFVINTCGAEPGKYKLLVGGVCFDVIQHYFDERVSFEFEVC